MKRIFSRLPWQHEQESATWDEHYHAVLIRSLASILFIVSGCVQLLTLLLPGPANATRTGIFAVGIANILIGFAVNRIPAHRVSHPRTTVMLIPMASAMVALYNYFSGPDMRAYAIFHVVCYVWLGVAKPRGTSLRYVPVLIVSYLIPMLALGTATWSSISSLVYVVPVCVLVAETLAWMVLRLRTAEAELERRNASVAIDRAESRYRALIDQLPSATYILRENRDSPHESRFEYVSPQILAMFGVTPEQWVENQHQWLSMIHPDDIERVRSVDLATYESGEPFDQEYRLVRADGQVLWILETARRVDSDRDGEYTWIGEYYDITRMREAEASLRETSARYQTLIEQIPLVTYLESIGEDEFSTQFVYISPQVLDMTGYAPSELLEAGSWISHVHPDDVGELVAAVEVTNRSLEPFAADYRMIRRDGHVVWVHDECVVVRDENGKPKYWHGFFLDITQIKQVEEKLRQSESEFRLLFYKNPLPAWVYDVESFAILEVNEQAVEHYGYSRDALVGMSITDLVVDDSCDGDDPNQRVQESTRHMTASGQVIHVETTAYPLRFLDRPAVLMIAQDVTSRHALQAQLAQQAFHDALTGLPNRALFRRRLESALETSSNVGVVFVDLDDFKRINDSLGHAAGDAVLVAIAKRLEPCVRAGDTIARLGGDEFTILLENCLPEDAVGVVERLYEALRVPVNVQGRDVVINPSIGIAIGDETVTVASELLRQADVAMYEAKRTGKARHVFFSSRLDHDAIRMLDLEADLRKAIQLDQLILHYQPIMNIDSGELVALEALVRWVHPIHGLISPATFIPLAEQTGLIVPLGDWVLRHACTEMGGWQEHVANGLGLHLSVNISPRQFQDERLLERVRTAVKECGMDSSLLTLEITESVALNNLGDTQDTVRKLKAMGLRVAIDDFGTGYSGLGYLQRCQIDTIKIDRSYIAGICTSAGDEAMVRAVAAYAQTLGVEVVAEGIETAEQAAKVREIGITMTQGYLYARPMPAGEIERAYFTPLAKAG